MLPDTRWMILSCLVVGCAQIEGGRTDKEANLGPAIGTQGDSNTGSTAGGANSGGNSAGSSGSDDLPDASLVHNSGDQDAAPSTGGGTSSGSATGSTAGTSSGGTTAGNTSMTPTPAAPSLDPKLSPAASDGAVCDDSALGNGGCGAGQTCRFYSPSENHCDPSGDGGLGSYCSKSSECDSQFVCFMGECNPICTLGTTECGFVDECADIGHATKGACLPW